MTYTVPWWSPSKFMAWDECPQEFHRRYILAEPIEPNVPMWFGTAVHKGLEEHYRGGDGELAFRRKWRECTAQLTSTGKRIPSDLFDVGMTLIERVAALGLSGIPERKVWVRSDAYLTAPVLGYVDLWSQETHTIFDFKTTLGSWSEKRAEREMWQPCIYSWAYWLETETLPEFEYIVLNRSTAGVQRFRTKRTHEQIMDCLSRAREIATAITSEQWDCTCGKHEEGERVA